MPGVVGLTTCDGMTPHSCYEISHLDEGHQSAVLMDSAPNEPLGSDGDVGLASRKRSVKAMGHEVVRAAKSDVLAVDDCHGQSGTRCSCSLDQQCICHPVPKPVGLDRMICRQANRQDSHLGDAGDVFERVSVELLARTFRRNRGESVCQHSSLCVERCAISLEQIPPLYLSPARAAIKSIPDEVMPATLSAAEPTSGDQNTRDDLQSGLPRFVEKRNVVFVPESQVQPSASK
jgi:hypothetical protein